MWQTRRVSAGELGLLVAGAILLMAAPVVLYIPAVLDPVVRVVSPRMSLPLQWLIFGATAPLGLALIMLPLIWRVEQRGARAGLVGVYLLMCGCWLMVMPGRIGHSSKVGAVASSTLGVIVLVLFVRRRRGEGARGFTVTLKEP